MKYKKIFISGLFRSGTSLLVGCLNAHQTIWIAWQPYWIFFKACTTKFLSKVDREEFENYPMGLLRGKTDEEQKLLYNIFDIIYFDKYELNSIVIKMKKDLSSKLEKINTRMRNEHLVEFLDDLKPGTAGQILTQLFDRLYLSATELPINLSKNLKLIGTKEVFCEEFINPFLNYYKTDSASIHIIRDPRAVIASRNYGKYMKATGSKYPIFFIINAWKRSVEYYLLNKNRDNYLMIRYEDLAREPQKVLKLVCEKLYIKFSSSMANFKNLKNNAGNRWQANSSFENPQTVDTKSIYKWQTILNSKEIEVIEYYCQKEMEILGYELSCRKFNLHAISNFKEDSSQINKWLRSYDFKKNLFTDY